MAGRTVMMNPAERLAALRALRHGLDAEIAEQEAAVHETREQTGARSFDTRFGGVSVSVRKPSLDFTDGELCGWARDNGQEALIVETASDPLKRMVRGRYTTDGFEVVDTDTGEVVDWPRCKPGGGSYLSVRLTDEIKQQAVAAIADRRFDDRDVAELVGGDNG